MDEIVVSDQSPIVIHSDGSQLFTIINAWQLNSLPIFLSELFIQKGQLGWVMGDGDGSVGQGREHSPGLRDQGLLAAKQGYQGPPALRNQNRAALASRLYALDHFHDPLVILVERRF